MNNYSISQYSSYQSYSSYSQTNSQGTAQTSGQNAAKEVQGSDKSADVQTEKVPAEQRQSPEKTADVMLNHVLNGLNQLAQQGAGQERLEQRLEAAREGIELGYEQAREQLDQMGVMDEELEASINQGYELIQAGLEKLGGQIEKAFSQPEGAVEQDNAYQQVTQVKAEQSVIVESRRTSASELNQAAANHKASYQESYQKTDNSLSLQVLTNDGDRVTINLQQSFENWSVDAQRDGNSISFNGQNSGLNWQLDVEGDLDEGEREALNLLLQDVEKLSQSFFSGDLGAALGQAMELGIDGSELAALDLNLQQSSFASSSQLYQQPEASMPTEALEGLKGNFLSYNDSYQQALEKAQELADPAAVLNQLIDQLLPDGEEKDIWQNYNQGLNELFSQEDVIENAELLAASTV